MSCAVAVVRAWREALNARDLARLLTLVSDRIEVLTPRGTERGVRCVREFIERQTYGVGLHIEQPRLFADGDTVVLAARAEMRWVDSGDLADASDMAAVFLVHDERIARMEIHDELGSALAAAGLSASHLVTDGHDGPSRPDHAKGEIMRRLRWMLVFAASAAAGLAGAPPAGATAPTTTVEQRHVKLPHGDCGSFTLIFEADVTRKVTTFYDQDGVPVRDVLVRRTDGTVSNSVTGKSLPTTGVWRVTRYYADGQLTGRVTQAGRTYLITVPGLGEIFHQTGYGIQQDGQTIFEAGPHDFDNFHIDELCRYLAG